MKSLPICIFLISAFVFGFVESRALGRFDDSGAWSLAHLVVISLCAFWWFRLDSAQLHRRPALMQSIAVVALPVVALPYWFFATRNNRRASTLSLIFLVTLSLFFVLAFVGLSLGS